MAAEDLFPNSLQLESSALETGAIPSLTFPAPIGAAWVLTSISAFAAYVTGVPSQALSARVVVLNQAAGIIPNAPDGWMIGGTALNTPVTFEWTGKIFITKDQSFTVEFTGGNALTIETLLAEAYPL